jgi:hypothetical protein
MSLPRLTLSFFFALFLIMSCKKDDFEENKPPVAYAGPSKAVTLPDSIVLSGTGTDTDSAGRVVAYLWSQVAGPAASTIVNPGATSTVVRFSLQGSYA